MDGKTDKELRELLAKFLNANEARNAMEDIAAGERILERNPAPPPDSDVLSRIRTEMGEAIAAKRRAVYTHRIWLTASAAAAVIVITVLSQLFHQSYNQGPREIATVPATESIWTGQDKEYAALTTQADEIEQDMIAMDSCENGNSDYANVYELETEYEQINSDFWKG
jgi:hypothetical protein